MNKVYNKIELISKLGTFTFTNKGDEQEMYKAMCHFESDNWKLLGEVSYNLYVTYEDGLEDVTNYDGINASCFLACHFDQEHAEQLDNFMQSQY